MLQSVLKSLWLKLESWRLRQHFKRVEAILRVQDVSHFPLRLRQARERHLNLLHNYAARGVFPRNDERPDYAPCFIDRDGRECAVAHLVMASGNSELADHIANVANYAYVPQMNFPELDVWSARAGLSKDELALIQPGYYLTLTGSLLATVIVVWMAGLVAFLINAVQLARKRNGIVLPTIGLILAIDLLLISIDCLQNMATAHWLGTHHDGWPYDRPLRDVGPLALGALISLGIALLAGGLGYYRARKFSRARNRNRQPEAEIVGQQS